MALHLFSCIASLVLAKNKCAYNNPVTVGCTPGLTSNEWIQRQPPPPFPHPLAHRPDWWFSGRVCAPPTWNHFWEVGSFVWTFARQPHLLHSALFTHRVNSSRSDNAAAFACKCMHYWYHVARRAKNNVSLQKPEKLPLLSGGHVAITAKEVCGNLRRYEYCDNIIG